MPSVVEVLASDAAALLIVVNRRTGFWWHDPGDSPVWYSFVSCRSAVNGPRPWVADMGSPSGDQRGGLRIYRWAFSTTRVVHMQTQLVMPPGLQLHGDIRARSMSASGSFLSLVVFLVWFGVSVLV